MAGSARCERCHASGGRPAVLIFADYTLYYPLRTGGVVIVDTLSHLSLRPNRDYRIIVLGLDAKDNIDDAGKMRQQQLAEISVSSSALLLRAGVDTIQHVTAAGWI